MFRPRIKVVLEECTLLPLSEIIIVDFYFYIYIYIRQSGRSKDLSEVNLEAKINGLKFHTFNLLILATLNKPVTFDWASWKENVVSQKCQHADSVVPWRLQCSLLITLFTSVLFSLLSMVAGNYVFNCKNSQLWCLFLWTRSNMESLYSTYSTKLFDLVPPTFLIPWAAEDKNCKCQSCN